MQHMLLVTLLALGIVLGALPAAAQSPEMAPLHRAEGEVVEGSYIVVMKPGAAASAASRAAEGAGVRPSFVYEHALQGFAARMNSRQLDAIRRNPNVAYVEEDQVASIAGARSRALGPRVERPDPEPADVRAANQQNPPWNLDRIDQRFLPLDGWYRYNTTASNVDIYIVDTGIQLNHPQLPRAMAGYDAFGGNSNDCNGHGTAVAGIPGSGHYGVAKSPYLWSVRVLNCSGSGSYSGIIAGTDWVRQHAASWPGYPAVANYSLGGGYSSALNSAVDNLSNSGVFVAVAAGSGNVNACHFSPASAATVFTTMGSDSTDRRAPGSNYGQCTDAYAPAVDIATTWLGGGGATLSGTSFASAHAAGIGAMFKAYGDQPSVVVRNWMTSNATHGVISGNPSGTPNRLVFKPPHL